MKINVPTVIEIYLQATVAAVLLPLLIIVLPFTPWDYAFILEWLETISIYVAPIIIGVLILLLPLFLAFAGVYLLHTTKKNGEVRNRISIKVALFINLIVFALMFTASIIIALTFQEDLRNLSQQEPFAFKAYSLMDIAGAWDSINSAAPQSLAVKIGVIDTGMDGSGDRHPEFRSVAIRPISASALIDSNDEGHGTQVAGIIGANNLSFPDPGDYQFPQMNGILSGVHSLDYELVIGKRSPTIFSLAGLVNDMSEAEVDVINMSFANPVPGVSALLTIPYLRIFNRNPHILFVVAAGQLTALGQDLPGVDALLISPANLGGFLENVITVAATDITEGSEDTRVESSNFGSAVNIAAPGVAVYSPAPRGRGNYPAEGGDHDLFFGGTSASTPLVTGVAGLLKALNPSLSPADIKDILISPANTDPVTTDPDKPIGRRLNAFKAVCDARTGLVCDESPLPTIPQK